MHALPMTQQLLGSCHTHTMISVMVESGSASVRAFLIFPWVPTPIGKISRPQMFDVECPSYMWYLDHGAAANAFALLADGKPAKGHTLAELEHALLAVA
jgi:hypothetical protein